MANGGRQRVRMTALVAVTAAALASCSTTMAALPPPVSPQVSAPTAPTTVLAADGAVALAVAASAALYVSAPVVVLAAADDPAAQAAAGPVAERLGVPLLLTPPPDGGGPVEGELTRLEAGTVLAVGEGARVWGQDRPEPLAAEVVTDEADLPAVTAPPARGSVLVLTQDSPDHAAATSTARASGAAVDVVPGADPRTDPEPPPAAEHVVALGSAFGTPEVLAGRLALAASGIALPGGGQLLFPGRRLVALYGHPGAPALGVLGEQGPAEAARRAQELAAQYQPLVDEPVVPTFEIIATVADSSPGADGDYSAESEVADLRPWVDAARDAGGYVLLDLQPGRTDFLTQARRYAELLAEPHVGLALDPEWRLRPDQKHLAQIGSVSAEEVNQVITWLADLTRDRVLPQKVLMLHQFRLEMIAGRERLDTSRDELAVVLHADGFGTPDLKFETWQKLHQAEPPGVSWGWKNFIDEDTPMLTPQQTVAITPAPPVIVTYQ